MTALWIAVVVAAALAAAWLVRPFLRQASVELNEADAAISIFRDQVDELRRDSESGLISPDEFDAAQEEIESRALKAAKSIGGGISVSRRAPAAAGLIAVVTGAAALALYGTLGAPQIADQPLAERKKEALTQKAEAGDLGSRIEVLVEKTKDDPRSFEDWWMLARSYSAMGDHASAADAYRNAAGLSDDRPAVLAAYAESLTLANGNKVPQAARLVFEQVLQKTPDPRARYYVALSKAQAQDFEAAIEDWTALARESAPDAPWMPLVRRDITNMARFLKRDVRAYLPDATEEEIARAGADPANNAALNKRAADLVIAVETDPKDYKGWIELAQIRAALGEEEKAAEAVAKAKAQFAGAPFVLGKIDEAARALGLDVLETTETARGPSTEDIAAAATMTESERASMVAGMVAGLAAKLEENPDDPDGWIMLMRSYSVLGDFAKAQKAFDTARAHFASNGVVVDRLKESAPQGVSTE